MGKSRVKIIGKIAAMAILGAVVLPGAGQAANKHGATVGEWRFACQNPETAAEKCQMSQQLSRASDRKLLLVLTVGRFGRNNQLGMLASTPLGIHLPAGLQFQVDDGISGRFTMQHCLARGCEATLRLEGKLLDAMRAGQVLNVRYQIGGGGQALIIPGSLKGFTKGLLLLDAP